MLGYAFMGKAHSNAFKKIPYLMWPAALEPKLVGIAGRNTEAVRRRRAATAGSTRQATGTISSPTTGSAVRQRRTKLTARRADDRSGGSGKHVVCEKPLGRDADESYDIWRSRATGVKHMCAFTPVRTRRPGSRAR